MSNIEKNKRIAETGRKTRERHSKMACKVYTVKVDKSKLRKALRHKFKMLFVEAKWLSNAIIANNDIFNFDTKVKEVPGLDKDRNPVIKPLNNISSQMKQGVLGDIKDSILALSATKKKGKKVGRLKFKREVNSIPLQQYGKTYKIKGENYIKVQGCKRVRVRGLKQIPEDAELANGKLVHKNGDYYIAITCFVPPKKKKRTGRVIGLDFGIKTSVTDSNGQKHNFQFPETERIRKCHKRLAKKTKGSKNFYKAKRELNRAYEKQKNQKKETTNKYIHGLVAENDLIAIQDENIKAWHASGLKGHGRRVQHSIMGGITSGLKHKPETLVVDRFFPSTKLCMSCGALNETTLADRIYKCECGYEMDRDVHSARNILAEGLRQLEGRVVRMSQKMVDGKSDAIESGNGSTGYSAHRKPPQGEETKEAQPIRSG